jgi:hypothetical protein
MANQPTPRINYEEAMPTPEFLIKSIAEQGYSLETSLSDLIDNSVSAMADKVEVLIDTENIPFTLFLADNGTGMDEEHLKRCMQFPSASMESTREKKDLGRFGLGMKTASFAQTRRLTVLSRKKGQNKYHGRTWDVDYLKNKEEWRIIVNAEEEVASLITQYSILSEGYQKKFTDLAPNTIVVWQRLYKFEDYLDGKHKSESLKHQITTVTTEYLSLVFHRFMERRVNPLLVRVNNIIVTPFNPFPTSQTDLRLIESKQKNFKEDIISLEGFVLPVRSIEESKEENNIWTLKSRGLMDMEGLYIYRADRVISFGGWNNIIRKSPRLQLARLKVEVGNKVDNLLHLNVAKSNIVIPFDLKTGFLKYIVELRDQAEKEYFNRGVRTISSRKSDTVRMLFERKASNKGMLMELNVDFPLIHSIVNNMAEDQKKSFSILLKMINTAINRMRQVHEDTAFLNAGQDDTSTADELISVIKNLLNAGTSKASIKASILPALGYRLDTIPESINQLLS